MYKRPLTFKANINMQEGDSCIRENMVIDASKFDYMRGYL